MVNNDFCICDAVDLSLVRDISQRLATISFLTNIQHQQLLKNPESLDKLRSSFLLKDRKSTDSDYHPYSRLPTPWSSKISKCRRALDQAMFVQVHKKGPAPNQIGAGPELIFLSINRPIARVCYGVGRYSLTSSMSILPAPPGAVVLPLVPRPTAILSTFVRFMP